MTLHSKSVRVSAFSAVLLVSAFFLHCSDNYQKIEAALSQLAAEIDSELSNRLKKLEQEPFSKNRSTIITKNIGQIYFGSTFKNDLAAAQDNQALKPLFDTFYKTIIMIENLLLIHLKDTTQQDVKKSLIQALNSLLKMSDAFKQLNTKALAQNSSTVAGIAKKSLQITENVFSKTNQIMHYDIYQAQKKLDALEKKDIALETIYKLQALKRAIQHDLSVRLDIANQRLEKNEVIPIEPLNELYSYQLEIYANAIENSDFKETVHTLINTIKTIDKNLLRNPKIVNDALAKCTELGNSLETFKVQAAQRNDTEAAQIAQLYFEITEIIQNNTQQLINMFVVSKKLKGYVERSKAEPLYGKVVKGSLMTAATAMAGTTFFGPLLAIPMDLAILTYFGGGLGGISVAGIAASQMKGSPAWNAQLQRLYNEKDKLDAATHLYLGVPDEHTNKSGKLYLLSARFNDISHATKNDHYEIYLMPTDENITNLFLTINHNLMIKQNKTYKDAIAFLGIRPTPGVTQSPYNNKNLPRIIIGLKPGIDKQIVKQLIELLDRFGIETRYNDKSVYVASSLLGSNTQPRYSKKYNNLIYTAYGSADYKDGKKFKESIEGKQLLDKTFMQKTWFEWWYGPTDEDMAYPDKSKDPFTPGTR